MLLTQVFIFGNFLFKLNFVARGSKVSTVSVEIKKNFLIITKISVYPNWCFVCTIIMFNEFKFFFFFFLFFYSSKLRIQNDKKNIAVEKFYTLVL